MKYLLASFLFFTFELLACPYCAGNTEAPDRNTWLVLAVFIALIYIPFYLLFRLAFKKKVKKNEEASRLS